MKGTRLTDRQRETLDIVRHHLKVRGVPPSRPEIARALGVRQQAGVDGHLNALAKKGWVKLHPGVERGIKLLREGAPVYDPSELAKADADNDNDNGLVGEEREPARLDSYDSIVEHFTVRPDLFVRVTDDSLDKAGYHASDVVAARRGSDARVGDIVVARVGAEMTLRRLASPAPEHLVLQPESTNPEHYSVPFDARSGDIEIVAVVVGAIVAARRRSAEREG